MTKLIIFDLDGVLVEAKQIHYDTLNQTLKEIDEKYKDLAKSFKEFFSIASIFKIILDGALRFSKF